MLSRISKRIGSQSRYMRAQFLSSMEKPSKVGGQEQQEKKDGENLTRFYIASKKVSNIKVRFPPEIQEEHARIGKEFHRQSFLRFIKMQKDLTDKIWLQQEAMRALPQHLVEHAKSVSMSPPAHRPWPWFETPPIKGFDPREYGNVEIEVEKDQGDEDD